MNENKMMSSFLTEMTLEKAIKDKMTQFQSGDDDLDDDFDPEADKILQKMRQDRLSQQKTTQNKENFWPGEYREIVEEEFLPYVTKNKYAVVHFFHNDFERCKIMDKHLRLIASQHNETAFVSLNAEKAPFFIAKLAIKMLPTLCLFDNGVLIEKIVGFANLGNNDEFKTWELSRL